MEFGRVLESELNEIDFALAVDPLFNRESLSGIRQVSPKVYVGCAKWGRTEWLGKIYPKRTKEKDFLDQYLKHYNSIELNATHYTIYGAPVITKWAGKAANRDFLFCPKMYQGITHRGNLNGKNFITTEFLRGILAFKNHLGPIFVQVSDSFSPKRKEELFNYLRSLPTDLQFFLEVRHPEWFSNPTIKSELFETLRSQKMGAVITDTSGRRDCAHMHLPVSSAFIRYVGNSLHQTDYTRINDWMKRIQLWLEQGIESVYFFMHMHEEAFSPELTVYLIDQLNSTCGLQLKKPVFLPPETLFE